MSRLEILFVALFPLLFVGLWLTVTTVLSRLSDWPALAARFPDRPDEARRSFYFASGMMGAGVSWSNALMLSACEAGLRVGVFRPLGLFSPPFFVPWNEIAVQRKTRLVMPRVILSFGNPEVGRLEISASLADKIAKAAGGRWPERGGSAPQIVQRG